jgi:hypothetical protein
MVCVQINKQTKKLEITRTTENGKNKYIIWNFLEINLAGRRLAETRDFWIFGGTLGLEEPASEKQIKNDGS